MGSKPDQNKTHTIGNYQEILQIGSIFLFIYFFLKYYSYSIEPFSFVIAIVQSYYFPSKPYLSAPPGANQNLHCLLKSCSISF